VGSFSSGANADNLRKQLENNGYLVVVEQADSKGRLTYRVKVGKFRLRQEAELLAEKLSENGYPTKICP